MDCLESESFSVGAQGLLRLSLGISGPQVRTASGARGDVLVAASGPFFFRCMVVRRRAGEAWQAFFHQACRCLSCHVGLTDATMDPQKSFKCSSERPLFSECVFVGAQGLSPAVAAASGVRESPPVRTAASEVSRARCRVRCDVFLFTCPFLPVAVRARLGMSLLSNRKRNDTCPVL